MKLSGINDCCSILVVSPLKSIINDQIADIAYESLGYTGTAVELSEETLTVAFNSDRFNSIN